MMQIKKVLESRGGRPANGYELDGVPVPGVTTIAGRIKNAGPLLAWYKKQGALMGEAAYARKLRTTLEPFVGQSLIDQYLPDHDPNEHDPITVRDHSAAVGTAVHEMIEHYLSTDPPISRTTADGPVLVEAMAAFRAWKAWWATQPDLKPIMLEVPMVSRVHAFGGTCDAVMRDESDGALWLVDWKTSNSIYADVLIQCAAYMILLEECESVRVSRVAIVNVNRRGGVVWYKYDAEDLQAARDVFLDALRIHKSDRVLEKIFASGRQ